MSIANMQRAQGVHQLIWSICGTGIGAGDAIGLGYIRPSLAS